MKQERAGTSWWHWRQEDRFKTCFGLSSLQIKYERWRGRRGKSNSSVDKECACNAGDPGSTPGLGRSSGEGIGYTLQYSSASLVALLVKNLPALWETWVPYLGWEDTLGEGRATHSSILVWRIPMDRAAWWATVHGVAKSQTRWSD